MCCGTHMRRSEDNLWELFSPSTMWALMTALRSSGLAAGRPTLLSHLPALWVVLRGSSLNTFSCADRHTYLFCREIPTETCVSFPGLLPTSLQFSHWKQQQSPVSRFWTAKASNQSVGRIMLSGTPDRYVPDLSLGFPGISFIELCRCIITTCASLWPGALFMCLPVRLSPMCERVQVCVRRCVFAGVQYMLRPEMISAPA